jgi:hypothetical protein
MATKSGTLNRIVSKTMAAGSEHIVRALKGEETLPEAAGAAVEDLLSGSTRPAPKAATRKAVKSKGSIKKKPAAAAGAQRKKAKK